MFHLFIKKNEMKHLKKFNEVEEYSSFISGNCVYSPNVSLVKNEYHNLFSGDSGNPPSFEVVKPTIHYNGKIEDVGYGWICYFDGNYIKLCSKEYYQTISGLERNTPIGVVVVPSNHINDGTVRICALRDIVNAPTSTSASTSALTWCLTNSPDVQSLKNLNKVTKYDNTDGGTIGFVSYGYLPSETFNAVQCATDTIAYYQSSNIISSGLCIPSPYTKGDLKYEDYFNDNANNALTDFNGFENTCILKNSSENYYEAAISSYNYHQTNDNGIQWYLPSCGELAYVVPRRTTINNSLTLIGGSGFASGYYWSSSEYSSSYARYVGVGDGRVGYGYKSTKYRVRPFAKVVLSPFCF